VCFTEETERLEESEGVGNRNPLQEIGLGLPPGQNLTHYLGKIWIFDYLLCQIVLAIKFSSGIGKQPVPYAVMSKGDSLIVG
jgi:hypothetical protein